MSRKDVMEQTEFRINDGRVVYQNKKRDTFWVFNEDGTVSPLQWGSIYKNIKALHISDAEVDSFIKHPYPNPFFEMKAAE